MLVLKWLLGREYLLTPLKDITAHRLTPYIQCCNCKPLGWLGYGCHGLDFDGFQYIHCFRGFGCGLIILHSTLREWYLAYSLVLHNFRIQGREVQILGVNEGQLLVERLLFSSLIQKWTRFPFKRHTIPIFSCIIHTSLQSLPILTLTVLQWWDHFSTSYLKSGIIRSYSHADLMNPHPTDESDHSLWPDQCWWLTWNSLHWRSSFNHTSTSAPQDWNSQESSMSSNALYTTSKVLFQVLVGLTAILIIVASGIDIGHIKYNYYHNLADPNNSRFISGTAIISNNTHYVPFFIAKLYASKLQCLNHPLSLASCWPYPHPIFAWQQKYFLQVMLWLVCCQGFQQPLMEVDLRVDLELLNY